MSSAPVEMFFTVDVHARAWMQTWVTIFRRHSYDILNAEICFKREFRVQGINSMKVQVQASYQSVEARIFILLAVLPLMRICVSQDYNIEEILRTYDALNDVYPDVMNPLIDSVNYLNTRLGQWRNEFGFIDIGMSITDVAHRITESESTPRNIADF